eukprot:gene14644-17301_t
MNTPILTHPDLGIIVAEPLPVTDTRDDDPNIEWTAEANQGLHYIPLQALETAEQARLMAYFADHETGSDYPGRVLYTEEAASEYAALEHGRERRAICKTQEEASRVLQSGARRRAAAPPPGEEQPKTKKKWVWLTASEAVYHLRAPAASTFYIPYASPTATGTISPTPGEPLLLLPKLNLHRYPENSKKHPAVHCTFFGGRPKKSA